MDEVTVSKILIGGAPSDGVINSLRRGRKVEIVIGVGSKASRKFNVPYAGTLEYKECLLHPPNTEN